jgi:hypothetical protein
METTTRDRLYWLARTVIFLLLALWGVYWFVTRPKPERQMTLYIGDPATACAYPEDTMNIKKMSWTNEQGIKQNWEEFPNLEAAKAAGYRLCH